MSCQIDFIIGREIEVGGVYKGIVASIKEYGAFVEFNGGQQGLLHISELSHEPVSETFVIGFPPLPDILRYRIVDCGCFKLFIIFALPTLCFVKIKAH